MLGYVRFNYHVTAASKTGIFLWEGMDVHKLRLNERCSGIRALRVMGKFSTYLFRHLLLIAISYPGRCKFVPSLVADTSDYLFFQRPADENFMCRDTYSGSMGFECPNLTDTSLLSPQRN